MAPKSNSFNSPFPCAVGSNPILVIGGFSSDAGGELSDVEIVDVGGPNNPFCFKPSPYPEPIQGAFGEVINDQALVCGGYSQDPPVPSSRCFAYDTVSDQWLEKASMTRARLEPAAVLMEAGAGWWFSGTCEYSFAEQK